MAKKKSKKILKKSVAKKKSPLPKKVFTKKVVAKKKITQKAKTKVTTTKKTISNKVSALPTYASMLGKTVPSFSVFNSKGKVLNQDSFKGHNAVFYFYPKDDTPGCTIEGKEFSSLTLEFLDANTVVYGVSKDSVDSHDKFICKYDFKIDLISDEKEQLCRIFDVIKEKNMYGRKYMGIERSTFVLDENLKVIKEMRNISPEGHAQEVLAFVKSL